MTRYARADEFEQIAELDGASFGFHYDPQELIDARLDLDLSRVLITVDDERIVGVSAELPFDMTLPGGGQAAVTGLTWVSVELTHRRRGVLRALIERQIRERADAGDQALVLLASEGGIYGRYGFGPATSVRHTVVRRRQARPAGEPDGAGGPVRRMTTDAVRDVLPELYERWRRITPGAVTRDERRWQLLLLDREYQRSGRSGLFHLVHPDGYVSYRIKTDWGDGDPQHECSIVDYVPVTDQAHAALWQTVLAMDLVGTVKSYRIPLDDPLPMRLADPRAVETTHVGDGLWVRPLDVTALLAGRRYGVEVDCVIEVHDELLGDGRYALRGGPDGAECERTDRRADVTMTVADLGAVSLGGARLGRFVRAGRVRCDDGATAARLDLALLAEREPDHGTGF